MNKKWSLVTLQGWSIPSWAKSISFCTKCLPDWGDTAVKRLHHLTWSSNCCVYTLVVLSATMWENNSLSMAEKARETSKILPAKQFLQTPFTQVLLLGTSTPQPYILLILQIPCLLGTERFYTRGFPNWLRRYFPMSSRLKMNSIMKWHIICPEVPFSSFFLWSTPSILYMEEKTYSM